MTWHPASQGLPSSGPRGPHPSSHSSSRFLAAGLPAPCQAARCLILPRCLHRPAPQGMETGLLSLPLWAQPSPGPERRCHWVGVRTSSCLSLPCGSLSHSLAPQQCPLRKMGVARQPQVGGVQACEGENTCGERQKGCVEEASVLH